MCSIHSAAGEPPWPGWLGQYTLKSLARWAWKSSQRPPPPAPCRNRSGEPVPSCSMWIGVPRIESSRSAGISADEEAPVRRQPLPGEERAVVRGEEERGGRDLVRRAGASERRAGSHRLLDQRRNRRSEEHTSELQSRLHLVCRLLLEKKKQNNTATPTS